MERETPRSRAEAAASPWVAVPIPGGQHLSVRAGSLAKTADEQFGIVELDGFHLGVERVPWGELEEHEQIVAVYKQTWRAR